MFEDCRYDLDYNLQCVIANMVGCYSSLLLKRADFLHASTFLAAFVFRYQYLYTFKRSFNFLIWRLLFSDGELTLMSLTTEVGKEKINGTLSFLALLNCFQMEYLNL